MNTKHQGQCRAIAPLMEVPAAEMTDIRINNNRFARDVVIFRTQARKGRGGFPCQRPRIQAQGGSVTVLVHTARTQGGGEATVLREPGRVLGGQGKGRRGTENHHHGAADVPGERMPK